MLNYDFSKVSVLVVGDIILDNYLWGSVDRISPEAPVPIANIHRVSFAPGGAANVANNIVSLGARTLLVGTAGEDLNRGHLDRTLKEHSIENSLITIGSPTTTKIRVISNHQQMLRIDFEDSTPVDDNIKEQITGLVRSRIGDFNVVVISDYNKGVCTPEICRNIIAAAKEKNIPVIIDPKGKDWSKYNGATLVTPNLKELNDVTNHKVVNDNQAVEQSVKNIFSNYDFAHLLITRSEKGMTLAGPDSVKHFTTKAKEVYDVSGAGDTVIAALSVGIGAGFPLHKSVEFANLSAGIVVGKLGTVPVKKEDFATISPIDSKILTTDELAAAINTLRKQNKRIVFTNGCFDILHIGHVRYLEKAKELGDVLILGLNTDASVKRIKGENRPVNNEHDRAVVLGSLSSIDYIVMFDEDTPADLISRIKPDFLVKGGDYRIEDVVGRESAGEVVLIDFIDGYSTTGIIEKMSRNS